MNSGSLEWLAGIMEGEGYFGTHKGMSGRKHPRSCLHMTDEDVVRRAQSFAGIGTVRKQPRPQENRKDIWEWKASGYKAVGLWLRLYPYLGERRRKQVSKALRAWRDQSRPHPERTGEHCKHGHLYDEANTYLYRKNGHLSRACRTCKREAARRAYWRKRVT